MDGQLTFIFPQTCLHISVLTHLDQVLTYLSSQTCSFETAAASFSIECSELILFLYENISPANISSSILFYSFYVIVYLLLL